MDQIGITMGDPSGIGPEIVAHALSSSAPDLRQRLVVFCDRAVLERGARAMGVTLPDDVNLADRGELDPDQALPGKPSARGGLAQVAYLESAALAAHSGDIAGLVTAPISKSTARAAHFEWSGHTEFLASRLGASRVAMMFVGPRLKVVLATTHLPLMAVGPALTVERVAAVTLMGVESLRGDFGVDRPRVGVLGLNPHASESGIFGHEEQSVIEPAVELARRRLGETAEIVGPLVPDAAFRQPFDLFVAMYHDQALIPVKLLDFEGAVNLTLGLPIVRTSPDHGVAYDLAGTGQARPDSFLAALSLCQRLVDSRTAGDTSAPE